MPSIAKSLAPVAWSLLAALVCLALALPVVKGWCDSVARGADVQIRDAGRLAPGYVLMPVSLVADDNEAAGEVRLVDGAGIVVHSWTTEFQPLVAYLEDDGDLVVSMIRPMKLSEHPGGTTGIIERLDWDGRVLFRHEDEHMNHDFEVLPDGSIAYMRWDPVPESFARRIVGGMPAPEGDVWGNEIVVINPEQEVTWTWHAHEHLDPSAFAINPLVPNTDWTHTNSIRYVEDNPITHVPAFLVSIRNSSAVILIDRATGDIIWRSPPGAFSLQHDATYLENGDILVFDNGVNDKMRGYLPASRAVEMNPLTNEVVWAYDGGTSPFEKLLFASSIAGGAERLPNGNTLITVAMEDRIYEVTADGKIAWEYVSDFRDGNGVFRHVFKARKYDSKGTEWGKRLPMTAPIVDAVCGA